MQHTERRKSWSGFDQGFTAVITDSCLGLLRWAFFSFLKGIISPGREAEFNWTIRVKGWGSDRMWCVSSSTDLEGSWKGDLMAEAMSGEVQLPPCEDSRGLICSISYLVVLIDLLHICHKVHAAYSFIFITVLYYSSLLLIFLFVSFRSITCTHVGKIELQLLVCSWASSVNLQESEKFNLASPISLWLCWCSAADFLWRERLSDGNYRHPVVRGSIAHRNNEENSTKNSCKNLHFSKNSSPLSWNFNEKRFVAHTFQTSKMWTSMHSFHQI